jgi:hypothetical protein
MVNALNGHDVAHRDYRGEMSSFYKESPTDTRFFPCPACREIISLGNATCRYCGVTVDESTARRLNAAFQKITDAVASANTFKQAIWLAVLITVVTPIYIFVIQGPSPRYILVSVAPVFFLGHAISWQFKYGKLETMDEDYPGAVRAMRLNLFAWAAALIVHVAVLGYALTLGVFKE